MKNAFSHEYCPTVLFLLNEGQMERLQMIQNRAMRAVMRVNKRKSIELMLETLNWMHIRQLISMRTIQFIHRMSIGKTPKYLNSLIIRNNENHTYNLRNKDHIAITNLKKTYTQNTLIYRGFKLYNGIPTEIKNETNMRIFNVKIRNWIKNNA